MHFYARLTRILLVASLFAFVGCEENVSPTIDIGRPYTLWGSLDPNLETQAIRVVPVELTIDADRSSPLDVEVASVNTDTGERVVWDGGFVEFPNGSTGWVATAPFRAAFGTSYRITATRPDGAASAVSVHVPEKVTPLVSPSNTDLIVRLPVLWPEAPRLHDVEVSYQAGNGQCSGIETRAFALTSLVAPAEYGWETPIPLTSHAGAISTETGSAVSLARVTLRGLVADGDWKPPFPFAFDPDIITQPGTISNVENGFGFVGASYRVEFDIIPDSDALRRAGFATGISPLCY